MSKVLARVRRALRDPLLALWRHRLIITTPARLADRIDWAETAAYLLGCRDTEAEAAQVAVERAVAVSAAARS